MVAPARSRVDYSDLVRISGWRVLLVGDLKPTGDRSAANRKKAGGTLAISGHDLLTLGAAVTSGLGSLVRIVGWLRHRPGGVAGDRGVAWV